MTALAEPSVPLPQYLLDAVIGLVAAAYERGRADAAATLQPAPEPLEETLTRQEAAKALRIGVTKLDLLVASGALRSKKIGTLRRFRRADIDEYLAKDGAQ
jgi:excisionase family DNA binding protein